MAVQITKRIAAVIEGLRVIGPDGDAELIALQCLRGTAELTQRDAPIVAGLGVVGLERNGAVVTR